MILVTYDVETSTPAGRKRLRKVAKACINKGQRVQNSVFECIVDATEYTQLKLELEAIIDPKYDSLRFYRLGNSYESKIETLGSSSAIDMEGLLFL